MGEAKRKSEVLHRKPLFGGQSAHKLHAELAWGNKPCHGCKGPPFIRLKSLITVKDLDHYNPRLLRLLQASSEGGILQTIQTIHGPAVVISDITACRNCAQAAERSAAHGPSWIQVEIDRGPGEDQILVGVS